MPDGRVLLGRLVALALDSLYVQQFGAVHVLDVTQDTYQVLDVMPVHGPEISDIHTLEHVVLMGELYLDAVVTSYDVASALIGH